MQWCCCSQRDSTAGAVLAQSVLPRGKGALFLQGNVPPRPAPHRGAGLCSFPFSLWLEMLRMIDQQLKSATSSRCWEQGEMWWQEKLPGLPSLCLPPGFAAGFSANLLKSLVKFHQFLYEIFFLKVSTVEDHIPCRVYPLSVFCLGFLSPNSSVLFNVQAGMRNICMMSNQKPLLLRTPHNNCIVQNFSLVY